MKNLETYADLILKNAPVRIKRSEELNKKFDTIANEIYHCPVRNESKRKFTTVLFSVEKMVIEHALAQSTGMILNPLEFDYRNRQSYAYDVIDPDNNATFECKRWAEKWFSFNQKDVNTFLKNTDIVDYFVSGKVLRTTEYFTVFFHLVADAKSFKQFIRPSQYNNKLYYDHVAAMRKNVAVYCDHVYFENGEAA